MSTLLRETGTLVVMRKGQEKCGVKSFLLLWTRCYLYLGGWVDEWTDRQVDEWMDRRIDRWLNGWGIG